MQCGKEKEKKKRYIYYTDRQISQSVLYGLLIVPGGLQDAKKQSGSFKKKVLKSFYSYHYPNLKDFHNYANPIIF